MIDIGCDPSNLLAPLADWDQIKSQGRDDLQQSPAVTDQMQQEAINSLQRR